MQLRDELDRLGGLTNREEHERLPVHWEGYATGPRH